MNERKYSKAMELIKQSAHITILTGAGMSTASGIADFRSPGGVWSKYKQVTFQEFQADKEKRVYYWKYKAATIPSMLEAQPNDAHFALEAFEKQGILEKILTQNIDGLHEKSGIPRDKIIRLHGTNLEAVCLSCEKAFPITAVLERLMSGEEDPLCDICMGLLKPNTISFGQQLIPSVIDQCEAATHACDLFLALGSSLQVYPAAGFVELAASLSKPIIIINRDPTPLDAIAEIVLQGELTDILPACTEGLDAN